MQAGRRVLGGQDSGQDSGPPLKSTKLCLQSRWHLQWQPPTTWLLEGTGSTWMCVGAPTPPQLLITCLTALYAVPWALYVFTMTACTTTLAHHACPLFTRVVPFPWYFMLLFMAVAPFMAVPPQAFADALVTTQPLLLVHMVFQGMGVLPGGVIRPTPRPPPLGDISPAAVDFWRQHPWFDQHLEELAHRLRQPHATKYEHRHHVNGVEWVGECSGKAVLWNAAGTSHGVLCVWKRHALYALYAFSTCVWMGGGGQRWARYYLTGMTRLPSKTHSCSAASRGGFSWNGPYRRGCQHWWLHWRLWAPVALVAALCRWASLLGYITYSESTMCCISVGWPVLY